MIRSVVLGVGRDTRPSGADLLRQIAEGFGAEGLAVDDFGVLPTPAVAWAAATGLCDVGVVLTASHNPAPDNGIKVFVRGGRKTSPEEEAVLDERIRAADPRGGKPTIHPRPEALAKYVEGAVRDASGGGRLDGMRLVVDCANGATTRTARAILEALGATVMAPVGSDPSGAINDACGTQHVEPWRAAIRAAGAQGGLSFDGDGDRVLLADGTGEVLDGDPILYLLGRDLDERKALHGRLVVATVMSNFGLETALAARGIRLERVPVGDRHVAARMRETGASLGGEQSGHVVLERAGALLGDGVLAGVEALQAARRLGVALGDVRRAVPRCPQVLKNVRVARKVPLEQAPRFLERVAAEEAALQGRGRVVVRYSGTEPLLRIMVEGPDEATVHAAVARLESAVGLIT